MLHSITDPLTTNSLLKSRQTITVTCIPVSLTYNHELPYSNTTDDSLSGVLLPENNVHDGQTLSLDIVLDTDHLDYSAIGNIDPD